MIKNSIKALTKFEWTLWMFSLFAIACSSFISGGSFLSVSASLIGVTALIFVAKGLVLGQILTVIFAVVYGLISFYFKYYGEMITYLCMTAPMAVVSIISWLKNPYGNTGEVKVAEMTFKKCVVMIILTVITTVIFYFILKALGNASLVTSTISVTTSFLASYMTFLRVPYYALGYAANDIVLIALWVFASLINISCLPMVICFVMFFVNDMYGYFNWKRMKKKQKGGVNLFTPPFSGDRKK